MDGRRRDGRRLPVDVELDDVLGRLHIVQQCGDRRGREDLALLLPPSDDDGGGDNYGNEGGGGAAGTPAASNGALLLEDESSAIESSFTGTMTATSDRSLM